MESGIEKISTVWLICLAGFGVALFILAIVPQANGMKNKAKTAIIPILPLVFVLSVGGFKGNSSRHALVLYAPGSSWQMQVLPLGRYQIHLR